MSHTQQEQFSIAWVRLWISVYHLGLPLAIVHWKATVQLLLKSYKILFNLKWMWSCGSSIRNMTACNLMQESAIKGRHTHYSICPSQLKYQMKRFWFKAREQHYMQHFVPYATVCLWSLYTEQSINYFGQKWTFSSKLISFRL